MDTIDSDFGAFGERAGERLDSARCFQSPTSRSASASVAKPRWRTFFGPGRASAVGVRWLRGGTDTERRHKCLPRPKTTGRLSTARCATRRLQYGDCVVRV